MHRQTVPIRKDVAHGKRFREKSAPARSGIRDLSDKVTTGIVDDLFRNFAHGDLRPKAGGPLTDAAATYDGMPETDFAGRPRVYGKSLDIGCYEGMNEAIRIIMR